MGVLVWLGVAFRRSHLSERVEFSGSDCGAAAVLGLRCRLPMVGHLACPQSRLFPETRNWAFEPVAGVECKSLWRSATGWSDWLSIWFREPIVEMTDDKSPFHSMIWKLRAILSFTPVSSTLEISGDILSSSEASQQLIESSRCAR